MASEFKRRWPSGLSPSAQPFVLLSRHGSGLSHYPSPDNWQPGGVGLVATTSSSSIGSLSGRHQSFPLLGFQGDTFTASTGGGDGAFSAAGNRGNNSLKIDAESYYPQYPSGVFQVPADFDGLVGDSETEFDENLMLMNSYIQLGQKMTVDGDAVNEGKSVDLQNRILQPLTHGNGSVSVTCGGSSSAQGMRPCCEPSVSLDRKCIGTSGDNKIVSNGTKQIDAGCTFLPGSESVGASSGISCSSDMHLTAISANPGSEATYQVSPTIWNYSDLNIGSYERSFSQQPSSYGSQMNLSPSSQSNFLQSLVFELSGVANNNDLFSSCPVKIKAPPITSHKSKDERNGKSINDDASASLFMTKSEVQISCPSVLHDATVKLPVAKDGEPVENSCNTFDENDSDLDSPCWKGRMADNHCTSKDSGLVDSSNPKSGQEEACSSLNPLAPQFFPSYIKPTGININSGSDDDSCISSQKTVPSALNVPSGDQVLGKTGAAESCSLELNSFVDTLVQQRQESVLYNSNYSSALCLSDLGQPLIGECCSKANAQSLPGRNLGSSVKGIDDSAHSDSTVDALHDSDWEKLLVELNVCDSQQLTVPSESRNRSLHTSDTKPLTVPNSLTSVKEIMDASHNDSSVSAVNDSDWSDMLGLMNHYGTKQHAVPDDSSNSSMLSSCYTVQPLLGLDFLTSNPQLLTGPDVGGSEKRSKAVGHEDSTVDVLENMNLGNVLGQMNQYDSSKHSELNNSSNSSLHSLAHLVQPLAEEDFLTFNAEPLAAPNLGVSVKGIRGTAHGDSTIITLNSSDLCNMQGHVYQCEPTQILDNFIAESIPHTSGLIQPLLGEDYLVSNGQPPLRPNVGSSVKAIGRPSQADSTIAVLNSSKSMHQDSKQHAVLDNAQNSSMLGLSEMLDPYLGEDPLKSSTHPLAEPNAGGSLKGTMDTADNESTNVSLFASSSSVRVCIPSESKETPGNATKSLGMRRLDVEIVVNTMNILSELLRQNCSIDSDCLNEHEHDKIKNIINNLSICIQNRDGNRTQMPELSLTGDSYCPTKSADLHQYSIVEPNRTGTKAIMRPPELLYQNEYQQQGLSASVIQSVLCSIPTTEDGVIGRSEFV